MRLSVEDYFERNVIPLVVKQYPRAAEEMCVQILGSHGMGNADEDSDLDAVVWLDDATWDRLGTKLQALLDERPEKFGPPHVQKLRGHPEITVLPFSCLGQRKGFLESRAFPPWEKVTIEELCEIHQSLVLQDPHGVFERLRELTTPECYPERLWVQTLVLKLQKLGLDLAQYERSAPRGHALAAQMAMGDVIEELLQVGFVLNKQYYPWRPHLRWAFERLPRLATRALPDIDLAASAPDWDKKLAAALAVREFYLEYVDDKSILRPETIEGLRMRDRFESWRDPDWRMLRARHGSKMADENAVRTILQTGPLGADDGLEPKGDGVPPLSGDIPRPNRHPLWRQNRAGRW